MENTSMSRSLQIYTNKYFSKYLEDDNINEICYNGDGSIWTQDNKGQWTENKENLSYNQMMAFGSVTASHKEDTLKTNKPILSATLNNGERIQVVIPPVTKKNHVSITIRKPSKTIFDFEHYIEQGMFENIVHLKNRNLNSDEFNLLSLYKKEEWVDFIKLSIKLNKNIVIAGATGSGKTTFMKSLIPLIPLEQRLISIEDTEELAYKNHKNYVQLFYPSEAKEGDPVTSATLLKSCLRMKPDRILLAELRGGETYDYLNILKSGHGGSITSIHAGNVDEAFERLIFMSLQNSQAQKIPFENLKQDFHRAIDIVIHIEAHNGERKFSDVYYKGAKDEKS